MVSSSGAADLGREYGVTALVDWASSILGLGEQRLQLAVVAGDASSRRYFRLHTDSCSWVLVDAPPATEKNKEFLAVQALLQQAGVRVPAVLASDLERGCLVLEDLGDALLLPTLNKDSVDAHYGKAMAMLRTLVDADAASLPDYDDALLREELGRFPEWFVGGLLGYRLSVSEAQVLHALGDVLVASALEQPRVLVHRDFHSRNLMWSADGELALIDFQDAVCGPLTYDLVSLLRDCYIRWSEQRVLQWAQQYRRDWVRHSGAADPGDARFLRWFDLMGLQRHIKVLGTFARLNLRDGKQAYLDDLPLVIDYTRAILGKYAPQEDVFAATLAWFDAQLMPKIRATGWGAGL